MSEENTMSKIDKDLALIRRVRGVYQASAAQEEAAQRADAARIAEVVREIVYSVAATEVPIPVARDIATRVVERLAAPTAAARSARHRERCAACGRPTASREDSCDAVLNPDEGESSPLLCWRHWRIGEACSEPAKTTPGDLPSDDPRTERDAAVHVAELAQAEAAKWRAEYERVRHELDNVVRYNDAVAARMTAASMNEMRARFRAELYQWRDWAKVLMGGSDVSDSNRRDQIARAVRESGHDLAAGRQPVLSAEERAALAYARELCTPLAGFERLTDEAAVAHVERCRRVIATLDRLLGGGQ